MKIAIDFENTLTKKEVFDFASNLLDQGIGVVKLTDRIGWLKNDQNYDILRVVKDLYLPYSDVAFTSDKKTFFKQNKEVTLYLSDNMINLQLADGLVTCVPLFGNKNWKEDCLTALGELV